MNDQPQTGGKTADVNLPALADVRVGIIGLGYVGLPLAVYMARHFPVAGFDINQASRRRACREARPHRRGDRRGVCGRRDALIQRRHRGAQGLQLLHRHGADADRPGEAARPDRADARERRPSASVLSPGDVVVYEFDGLSRRDRGGLRADPGSASPASPSIATFSSATRPSASTLAISSTGCRASSRSHPARRRKRRTWSTRSMARSSPPAPTR